jgi:hypothetical protein
LSAELPNQRITSGLLNALVEKTGVGDSQVPEANLVGSSGTKPVNNRIFPVASDKKLMTWLLIGQQVTSRFQPDGLR